MEWLKNVQRFYDLGIYTKADIREFVEYGVITQEDYKRITDDEYSIEQ